MSENDAAPVPTKNTIENLDDTESEEEDVAIGQKRKKPEKKEFTPTHEIHGLKKKSEYNGKKVQDIQYDSEKESRMVMFSDGTKVLVKEKNLKKIIPQMKLWNQLNGIYTNAKAAGAAGAAGAADAAGGDLVLYQGAKGKESPFSNAARFVATGLCGFMTTGLRNAYEKITQPDSPLPDDVGDTATGSRAAAGGGGFGFGRVEQAAAQDPPTTPLDQTFAGLFQTAGNNPTVFVPAHKISSCTDGEPKMANPIIQNGGIPWDICQRIPNSDKWGLVVWVATNARTNSTIQGVWVQDAGKPKCPYGPNCAEHANGECQNSHARCWAHGAPGFDGLPSNGCTCGKQGALAKVPGHAICHRVNHHGHACTHHTPLGPCAGHKWTPGNDDSSGILPQYCQAHLLDWLVEQIRNSILEEQDRTQSFPAPIDKEQWGPSNSAYMHLKTKCGDVGKKLVRNAITRAYGSKKTSLEPLTAWDAPLDDENY